MKNYTIGILLSLIFYVAPGQNFGDTCATKSPGAEWEQWFQSKISEYREGLSSGRIQQANYVIPVIVHIIHNGGSENISAAQVQSQIDILNNNFAGNGSGTNSYPTYPEWPEIANTGISFCPAKQKPDGTPLIEDGIERINWELNEWVDPAIFQSSESLMTYFQTTIQPNSTWDQKKYLNIWISEFNQTLSLKGFAKFPEFSNLPDLPQTGCDVCAIETESTGGIVIRHDVFGNIGTALNNGLNGTTATHEAGHYLGLWHIWGDENCGDDHVCDTPYQNDANRTCPTSFPILSSCNNIMCNNQINEHGDMYMNFMDYTMSCRYMFTPKQAERMQVVMLNGTYRKTLSNSPACQYPTTADIIIQNAEINPATIEPGGQATASCKVKNQGSGNAPASYTALWLSKDQNYNGAPTDINLNADIAVTSLSSGQTSTLLSKQFTIPEGTAPGSWYIMFGADATDLVSEGIEQEDNNQVFVPITVSGGTCTPPANNECTGAVSLSLSSGTTTCATSGITVACATQSFAANYCNGISNTAKDVWFKFTPVSTGSHSIVMTPPASSPNGWDGVLELFQGSPCPGPASAFACKDPSGGPINDVVTLNVSLNSGTTYYLRVYDYDGSNSNQPSNPSFQFCITSPGTGCATPSGTTETSIGQTTASLDWSSMTGAVSYNVRYRIYGTGTWTNTSASGSNINLSGLSCGTTYEWQVSTVCSGTSSSYSLSRIFTTSSCSSGNGDNCTTSIFISSNLSCDYTDGTVAGASSSGYALPSCNTSISPTALDVWYKFVADATEHTIKVNPEGSTNSNDYLDPVIALYGSCSSSDLIDCYDEPSTGIGGGVTTSNTFSGLDIGTTYYVRIYDWGNYQPAYGGFRICITHEEVNLEHDFFIDNMTLNANSFAPGDNVDIKVDQYTDNIDGPEVDVNMQYTLRSMNNNIIDIIGYDESTNLGNSDDHDSEETSYTFPTGVNGSQCKICAEANWDRAAIETDYNNNLECVTVNVMVDPCSDITAIEGCGSAYTQTYTGGGLGSWNASTDNVCGRQSPGIEKIYSFVAPTTGIYSIHFISAAGWVDYMWKSGSCSSSEWNCIDFVSIDGGEGDLGAMEWTAGTTYYLLLDDEDGTTGTHTFYINCPCSLPGNISVTGGGTFCNSTTLTASGGSGGTIYWQGTNSNGTSTATPSASQTVTATGTYYFRAYNSCGWGSQGSATVTINSTTPDVVSVNGGGTFCNSTTLTATGGSGGTIYWQGITSNGTSTATPSTSQLVTTSGTYYFRSYNGCNWGTQGSATVTINTAPSVVSVNGGGTFCNSATLTASGGSGGTIYWQGTNSNGTSTATPSTSQTVNTSGTYYFRAYNSCGWGTQGSATVTINNATPGTVSVNGGGTFCNSTTLTATGGSGGTIYWQGTNSNGTSTATPLTSQLVTSSGTYYFRAYNGCNWGPQGSATVTINNIVPGAVSVNGGGTFCNSTTLTATGGSGGTIYWQGTNSNGTSTVTPSTNQPVTSTGTYYFRAYNGCAWGSQGSATVTINPLPPAPVITKNGDILVSSYAFGNQWYRNGVLIAGATGQSYAVTQTGNYTVQVTDINGCTNISGITVVTSVGIYEQIAENFTFDISPNPNDGLFKFNLVTQKAGSFSMTVTNVIGQVILSEKLGYISKEYVKNMDLSSFSSGTYFITLENEGEIMTRKVTVQ